MNFKSIQNNSFEQNASFDMARFDYLQDKNGKLYLSRCEWLPALSNNYLYEYISTRRLCETTVIVVICLVAQKKNWIKNKYSNY